MTLEQLIELEKRASPAPWETINHEAGCPSHGYCSPNGCGGHESNVAYDISGPMFLRDGEVSGESEEEDRQQFQQADVDAKFTAALRNVAPAYFEVVQKAKEYMESWKTQEPTTIIDARRALRSALAKIGEGS